MKVLVIANSARSIACSARKAGYEVYALDRYGDVDMRKCARSAGFVNIEKAYELVRSFGDIDAVILGPGFEHLKFEHAFNNPVETVEGVSDKSRLSKKLRSMDIPHPETASIEKAEKLGFPLMVKPKTGSGGVRNVAVRNGEELDMFRERRDAREFIAQEFVEGIPCSASVISTGERAMLAALNEQLIGVPWLTGLPFAYCGNITPFHTGFDKEMVMYAEEIALEFKLLGSNGVDFVLNEKGVQVIEVNPRFQGSMDTVERSTGMNIFDAHIRSFAGELPESRKPFCFAAKSIVYANNTVMITRRVSDVLKGYMDKGQAADVPREGVLIKPDEPITTMLAAAKSRSIVLGNIRRYSLRIKKLTQA